jgi:hypothetical protein
MNNFKVGDWVNVTPNSKRGRVNYPKPFLGKIVVIDTLETQETVYCVHGQKKSDWVCESDIEKWKAKDGELCVFPRKPDEDIYIECADLMLNTMKLRTLCLLIIYKHYL